MAGLPSHMLEDCQHILEQCEQFHNIGSLRSIFVTTELARFRSELPDGANEAERVRLTIDFLITKRLVNGRSVFALFLTQLRKQYQEGDERYFRLTKLEEGVSQVLSSELIVPFVTIAMTRDQAEALIAGKVFDDWSATKERQAFLKLRTELGEKNTAQLRVHYDTSPDEWRPNLQSKETIAAIIQELAEDANQFRHGYAPIQPHFYSADFFSEDDDVRLAAWDELSWRGCILIVDAVSLYHPVIYRRLLQSEMGANERVAIATTALPPRMFGKYQAMPFIEQEIASRMQRAFVRSKWYEEQVCRHNIESLDTLRHWIKYTALPEAARIVALQKEKGRPKPKNKQKMQLIKDAPGFASVIFRQGVKP